MYINGGLSYLLNIYCSVSHHLTLVKQNPKPATKSISFTTHNRPPPLPSQETNSHNSHRDIKTKRSHSPLPIWVPSAAEECFTKNDIVFANRPHMLIGKHLGYNYTSLTWSSYGDHWWNLRRISSLEMLSSTRLQMLSGLRFDEVRSLVRRILHNQNQSVNMTELFELSMNVMMRMIAGKRYYETDPEYYTDDVISDLMLVLLLAGTDTYSVLLNHPEELKKAPKEIDNSIGHSRLIEESDLTKLPHLGNIINETLRLYPPVPLVGPHESSDECTVQGFRIPRGTTLLVNCCATQNDPKVWVDPREFKPERFGKGGKGGRRWARVDSIRVG
ncbi:hypothetical protein Ddye_006716 [Dipteronia dyeriana]|uniref:Cytochrome P450 n=1 Tax=Dipteronia dyeriana TaxID=168575 RepID=A0AAD9XIX5_9ROSI|nr:hypothetical protein Ddye_006716 [Dipteronia dyeriana]